MKKLGLYAILALLFALCVYPFLFLGHSFSFENGKLDYAIFHRAFTNPMTIKPQKIRRPHNFAEIPKIVSFTSSSTYCSFTYYQLISCYRQSFK